MLINLRNALMTGKRLPYDAEVEYLESSGTQYIDTGVTPSSSTSVEVVYKVSSTQLNTCIFSARTSAESNSFSIWNDVNGRYRFDFTASGADNKNGPSSIVGSYVSLKKDGNRNFVDGVEITANAQKSFSCVHPAYLFAMNNGGVANFFVSAMVASCKIWQNGTLVRDFITVRKKTVGYLYDRVSGKLFGNAGTGDFVLGPDVVPVEYIESHGTEYIDTGVEYIDSMDLECKFSCSTSVAGSKFAFGVYGSGTSRHCAFNTYRYWNTASAQAIFYKGSGFKTLPNNATNTVSRVSGVWRYNGEAVEDAYVFDNAEHLNMYLFAGNTVNVGTSYFFIGRMSGFKLTNNGTSPVCKFQPVRVGSGSTWEGAMIDTLTRRIYRNAGTGAFSYGNDLKYPIPA